MPQTNRPRSAPRAGGHQPGAPPLHGQLPQGGGQLLPAILTARTRRPVYLDFPHLELEDVAPKSPRDAPQARSGPATPRAKWLVQRSEITERVNVKAAERLDALTSSAGDLKTDPLLRFRRKLQAIDDVLARKKVEIEQTFDSVRDLLERASGGPDQYKGVLLTDGVPRTGVCSSGTYRYYKYVAGEPAVGVRFSVRGAPGSPYLFVSTTTEYPSRETAMWYTKTGSSEGLTVLSSDPRFQATGAWYIALCSHTPSEYTLSANSILPLKEGVRRASQVCSEAYRLFRFALTDAGASLRVEKRAGGSPSDLELFVSTSGPPTRGHHMWRSGRSEAVALSPGAEHFAPGPFYIAAYGAAPTDVPFSLLVLTMQDLKSGVVCNGRVHEGAFRYFRLENTIPGAPVRVELRCAVPGAALYASTKDPYPSKQSCTWLAGDAGGPAAFGSHADPFAGADGEGGGARPRLRTTTVVAISIGAADPDYQAEGYYYVAVSAAATADFTICASIGGKRAMRGAPQGPPREAGERRLAPAELEVARKLEHFRESAEEQEALHARIEAARDKRRREIVGSGGDHVAENARLAAEWPEALAERVPWSEVYAEREAVARARRKEREERERAEGERAVLRKQNAAAIRELRGRQRRLLVLVALAARARLLASAMAEAVRAFGARAERRVREEQARREAAAARIGRFYRVKRARWELRRHTRALYVVHRAMVRVVIAHRVRRKREAARVVRATLHWLQNRESASGATSRFVKVGG
eukprot:tig00021434_g21318.t1